MALRQIRELGDPCLLKVCKPVKEVNERISKKTNAVIISADSITPSVAPSVISMNI